MTPTDKEIIEFLSNFAALNGHEAFGDQWEANLRYKRYNCTNCSLSLFAINVCWLYGSLFFSCGDKLHKSDASVDKAYTELCHYMTQWTGATWT